MGVYYTVSRVTSRVYGTGFEKTFLEKKRSRRRGRSRVLGEIFFLGGEGGKTKKIPKCYPGKIYHDLHYCILICVSDHNIIFFLYNDPIL